jgi:predicted RNA-binding Zn-ribbon protein involved in translation (DUF1610 family)
LAQKNGLELPDQTDYLFLCPNCQQVIGHLFELEDEVFLLNTGGGALAVHYAGVCKSCGETIYFDARLPKLKLLKPKITV